MQTLRPDEFRNVLSFLPFKEVCASMRVSSQLQSTAVATVRLLTTFETMVASDDSFKVICKYTRRLRSVVRPYFLFEDRDPNLVARFLINNSLTLQSILAWIPAEVIPLLCWCQLVRVTNARCVVSSGSASGLPLLLPSLTNLTLRCNKAVGVVIGTMLSSTSLRQLVSLTVMKLNCGQCDGSPLHLETIASFTHALAGMSCLTELRIYNTSLRDRGARALAGLSQSLPALQVLMLRHCRIREAGIRALGESFRALKVFGIAWAPPSFGDLLAESGACIGAYRYFPELETVLVLFPVDAENAELAFLRQSRPSLTIGSFCHLDEIASDVDMFNMRF